MKDLITSPAPGIETVHDIILYAARVHGQKPALSTRPILKTIHEDKEVVKVSRDGKETKEMKRWTYYKLGDYQSISYEEVLEKVRRVGSGLSQLGVGEEGETMFSVYAQTRWVLEFRNSSF